jgi:hypothetical protein
VEEGGSFLSEMPPSLLPFLGLAGMMPPKNPPWPPTYLMRESTISMQCNGSGWSNATRGSEFGIVSYDWSNAKAQWAATKPMDCEERLLTQAQMTKASGGKHVFVYRNIVKALPWFSSVREKLLDPLYAGWFLRFDASKPSASYHQPACAAEDASKCSPLYHDQLQTPEVPTPEHPDPDGKCDTSGCDCGPGLPCGEYLFDHRNDSLREWLVAQVISPTALGDPSIDGLFIDDFWCSNTLCAENPHIDGCPCNDPVQGPTEIDPHSQVDMGLSDAEIKEITLGWNRTMGEVQAAILRANGYTWSLMFGQQNANAAPRLLTETNCAEQLRKACNVDSDWQKHTILFGLSVNQTTGSTLAHVRQDVAFFLLARGPYAYAGWGVWGMTWPFQPEPAHGELPPEPHGVPLPPELLVDYGEPDGLCHEVSDADGVFERKYSKAGVVSLNCRAFEASLGSFDA